MPITNSNPSFQRYKELVQSLGSGVLHNLYPNDFEAYIMSFELVDSKDRVVDFFVFPIMPEGVTQSFSKITNIKKTAGGITVLSTPNFVPINITLQGTFGRSFKFVLGSNFVDASAIKFSTISGNYSGLVEGAAQINSSVFSSQIKTGYGCYKVLESIFEKHDMLDDFNQPFRLYFYNMMQGKSFLVKGIDLSSNMSQDRNMIWDYTIQLTAVAPITGTRKQYKDSLMKSTSVSVLNEGADIVASKVASELNL